MTERDWENIVIGSTFEGASDVFKQKKQEDTPNDDETIVKERAERKIFPDAKERYEKRLKEVDLEHVEEMENGYHYPNVDDWITFRIKNRRGTKFYPSFANDAEGKTYFCKTQISENSAAVTGLDNEANRLFNIPEGVNAPKIVRYLPSTDSSPAVLIIEAVPFEEAYVRNPTEWTNEHATSAAKQIHLMENTDYYDGETEFDPTKKAMQLLETAGDTVFPEVRQIAESVIKNASKYIRPVFVHGDLCTKNILTENKEAGGVRFVDWEFDGNGFLGQDAAKLYSELYRNQEAGRCFLDRYLRYNQGRVSEERLNMIIFGTVLENLVHLAWRKTNIIDKNRQAEVPDLSKQIDELNQRVLTVVKETSLFE